MRNQEIPEYIFYSLISKIEWRPLRLPVAIAHSQRFNSGKPLGTGCCEWLWVTNCNVGKRMLPKITMLSHSHYVTRASTKSLHSTVFDQYPSDIVNINMKYII